MEGGKLSTWVVPRSLQLRRISGKVSGLKAYAQQECLDDHPPLTSDNNVKDPIRKVAVVGFCDGVLQ